MAARIDKIVISELAATELLSPKPQPTHTKNCRFGAILRTLCAVAGQIANTPWRTPTKLMGDPDLPLLDTPSEAICAICFTFLEMSTLLHRSEFINVSIIIVASSSIGAGDDHETDAGCFGGRVNLNYFFVARNNSNAAPFKQYMTTINR